MIKKTKMGEAYFNLKRKLEDLGYNNLLPVDGVPLVECLLADLLQTTRSLQHYMDLSKEALMQRDSLMLEAEPYKCDNAKLIQENNHLHRENIRLKEENLKLAKDMRRKITSLSEELMRKDSSINKLQHELRDLSLRGLCADTLSTRLKSKRKDNEASAQTCSCLNRKPATSEVEDLNKTIKALEEKNNEYKDEILLLKMQVEHRDNEIIRLNILLEGGRPLTAINKDCCNPSSNNKLQNLMKEIRELETANVCLKKEIDSSLEKQHEAMLRALTLADKNKSLQEEIKKVDTLALRVEEDCNKRLSEMMNEMNFLQSRIEGLTMKNAELERQLSNNSSGKSSGALLNKLQESVNVTKKENEALQKEIKDLVDLNKSLQEKILELSNSAKSFGSGDCELKNDLKKCPTKEELRSLLERERMKYEEHIKDLQEKMSETMNTFTKHMKNCKDDSPKHTAKDSSLLKELHAKLCEREQKILMLKKENDDLKNKLDLSQEGSTQNYKDIISQFKGLQEKIQELSNSAKSFDYSGDTALRKDLKKHLTKEELRSLLECERMKYEENIKDLQEKMSKTMNTFSEHMKNCKDDSPKYTAKDNSFVRELHAKLCESEQKILMLKKENDDLKNKLDLSQEGSKQNYKDIISQLNVENSELSKENIALSQQVSRLKNITSAKSWSRGDYTKREVDRLKDTITELTNELQMLKKDKHEYNMRYKETMDIADKLKRDLIHKQKEIEQLEEENCSYKMTNRNGKASAEHLREECNFLKEQIKQMQSDVVKEKTLASQIKNIQLETERSSNEIQNELLCVQKKLSVSKDTIDSLERKCKDLQSEISALRNEKSILIDNIRKVDQERDKLVIELDHKTENVCVLEQKIKSQHYDICKLENEVTELKRKLNMSIVTEHKRVDSEAQISFLNGEILRLNQQLDTATMENKHLQNTIADLNGSMKLAKIEYDKSRKEVDGLKQQLQHYVAEIRRIEELLSQKEAERSDMLEHFASLSVEANILENTNHSLESESASKSLQLQNYVSKIESLESKLIDKDTIIENQASRIASMGLKITSLENEIKLVTEEKIVLEQNVAFLKQMCNSLKSENSHTIKSMGDHDSELKLYENRIKTLTGVKASLEEEKDEMKENLITTEKLLANARKEIVQLKLALQDATSETKSLQDRLTRRGQERTETECHETTLTREEYDLPIMLEEIHEVSHEEDEDSTRYHSIHKRLSKYTNSGTI